MHRVNAAWMGIPRLRVVSIGITQWITLVFSARVFVISVYIRVLNLRGFPASVENGA
jgi:hypothetical protein